MLTRPQSSIKPNTVSWKERRRLTRRRWLRANLLPRLSRPFVVTDVPAVILSPHQDDELLGCGGLIALKRRQEVPVSVVFITDGGQCLGNISDSERARLVTTRHQEALDALSLLDIPSSEVHFLDFPDGQIPQLSFDHRTALIDAIHQIAANFSEVEVYLPHRRDSHPDHEATTRYALDALRVTPSVTAVYEYPVWLLWSRNRLFSDLRWSDLSNAQRLLLNDVSARKKQAMARYGSQLALLPPGFVDFQLDDSEYFFPVARDARL